MATTTIRSSTYIYNGVLVSKADYDRLTGATPKSPVMTAKEKKPEPRPQPKENIVKKSGVKANFIEKKSPASLAQFAASFNQGGYALSNRFDVMINPPSKMRGGADLARGVSFRVESVTLPGRNLVSVPDAMEYGPGREKVTGPGYGGTVNMVFQATAGLTERVFFEEWQKLAFNEQTWDVGYYNDYIGTVDIYTLNKQDEREYGLKLYEVFPKDIGGTDLAQDSNNAIIKNTIVFQYHHWEVLDKNRSSPGQVWKDTESEVQWRTDENWDRRNMGG